ncbi:MAG: hypothetical protein EG826_01010 [Deltaproteobacteria bacterium]|nr:hypothetical protein [Deltaproteobacteria bacterium]
MKKLSGIVLCAALIFYSQAACALSGNDLAAGMKAYLKAEKDYTKADYLLAGNYMGYVEGVAEATLADYSLPGTVKPEQLFRIVADFLGKNPDRWNEPAVNLVRKALQEAYPKYLIRNK